MIGTLDDAAASPRTTSPFIKGPNGKLHHFAYHLEDWSAILRAGDIFSMDDVPIDIGPTRHGITRGTTIYFFDPSGNRNEVFAGLGYRVQHGLPDDQLDRRPARQGHLLPRPRAQRRLHQRLHLIRRHTAAGPRPLGRGPAAVLPRAPASVPWERPRWAPRDSGRARQRDDWN